jgi:hypothetical protein
MPRSLLFAFIVSLVAVSSVPLDAQDIGGAVLGRRVRVWAPNPTVGTVIRADSAVLLVVTAHRQAGMGDTITVSRHAIRRVDLSHGLHPATLDGARIGGALGGFIGGIVGAMTYHRPNCDPQTDLFCIDFGPGVSILAGVGVGGVAGVVIGAVIGSQSRVERWKPAPSLMNLRLTAAPSPTGLRLGVSAAF